MSIPKQILLSLFLIALAGGGWFVYQNRDLVLSLIGGEATVAEAAGPPGGPPGSGTPPGGGRSGGHSGFGGPALVVTAPVEMDSTDTAVRAIGTAEAVRSVTVYPQVTGIVASIGFTPGGEVEDQQVLVRLDSADQQVAVDRATIALESARQAVERAQRLSKSGSVTAVALSDAETAEQKAEIDLKSAGLELQKRTIRAPFVGMVGLSDIAVGDLVSSSKAIATIDDMASVTVAFEVPEGVVGRVALHRSVTATSPALPGETLTGTISAIDSRIDAATRTLKVEATLPNENKAIKPGMGLAMSLTLPGEVRPSVPSLAIQWDRGGSFVWKLAGDKVHRTPVQILGRRSGVVTVAGELGEGDQVVVEGVLRLREGSTVAPSADSAAAPAVPSAGKEAPAAPGAAAAGSAARAG